MRPRKGTKTSHRTVQQSDPVIYKDETPEGDENNVSPLRIDTHTYIYKDETPEGDENYSRIVLARSLKIYKDETPEGDEKNHGYNNLAISYHL